MKKASLLIGLILFTSACSLMKVETHSTTTEIESVHPTEINNPPAETEAPAKSPEIDTSVKEEVIWSVPYVPSNDAHIRIDTWHSHGLLGGGSIPLLPGEIFTDSRSFELLYHKGYAYDHNAVYIPSDLAKIASIDIVNGKTIWQSDLEGEVFGLGKNTIFSYRNDNRIYGLDKNNGEEKWKIILDALVSETEKVYPFPFILNFQDKTIIPMNMTCLGDYTIRFLYIDEVTGSNHLTECNADIQESVIPIAFIDGLVIAKSSYGIFYYGISVEDGSLRWSIGEEFADYSALDILTYDAENNILFLIPRYVVNDNADLISLNMTTGEKLWNGSLSEINDLTNFIPGFSSYSLHITRDYIINVDLNQVMVFQIEDGALINTITPNRTFKAYVSESGLVLYYPDLGVLTGIDFATSEELWQEDELLIYNWPYYSWSAGDIIMVRDKDANLVALDQKTGTQLWNSNIHADYYAIFEDKMIYFHGDNLIFLNLPTGISQELYVEKYGSLVSHGHMEIVDENKWFLLGKNLTMINIP
jgi:outer membrane protein assembly factor BamB